MSVQSRVANLSILAGYYESYCSCLFINGSGHTIVRVAKEQSTKTYGWQVDDIR